MFVFKKKISLDVPYDRDPKFVYLSRRAARGIFLLPPSS